MKEHYNWWTDPKNKEQVDRISWWEHEQNKTTIEFPISIINNDKYWVAASNSETKKLLGDRFGCSSQGDTKEEVIEQFFLGMKLIMDYSEKCRLSYQRWVPFRKGPWGKIGGNWFSVFGFHIYFRYGKNMKGGYYIPYTRLNVSFSSDWTTYKRYKDEQSKRTKKEV